MIENLSDKKQFIPFNFNCQSKHQPVPLGKIIPIRKEDFNFMIAFN